MDSKCVFVCGIGKVLMRNRIDLIEAGIIGHVRRWGPNYRIVIRVDSGHGFIFFEYESHKDAFLDEARATDSSWGFITVCNSQLGVKPYSGKHYRGAATEVDRVSVPAVVLPATPIMQQTHQAGTVLGALHSMAQRVQVPVGEGYGAARQVVRAGVPDFMAEDMIFCDFDWARANSFMILQPDGMSRICSLCGTYKDRKINMATVKGRRHKQQQQGNCFDPSEQSRASQTSRYQTGPCGSGRSQPV